MSDHYILDGHTPVPVEDPLAWARWHEEHVEPARVGSTRRGEVWVSTVFLGLDHRFGKGPPLLFETLVFGGEHDQEWSKRYSTWEEAEAGHAAMCARVWPVNGSAQ